MKKYFAIVIILCAASVFSSCKKVLDTKPFDRISDEVIWANKANAETFIFNTYNVTSGEGVFRGSSPYDFGGSDIFTSNAVRMENWGDGVMEIYTETMENTNDFGFDNWAHIRRCNQIIENVATSPGISDADKINLVAEGKFLRAISYYKVARKIGRICWIDKVLTPDDSLKLSSTANPTETYSYIIKDLEDAVAGMTDKVVAGRANKYTAAAYLSEVCLQALAYKNYPATPNVDPNDPLLQKAITNANLVINSGKYSLEADYGGMFNESKSTSPEIIFAIYRKAINTTVDGTPMQFMIPNIKQFTVDGGGGSPQFNTPNIFEAWGNSFPSQNFTDDYLTKDDANTSLALPWNQTSQYLAAVDETFVVPNTVDGMQRTASPEEIPRVQGETVVKQGRIKPASSETIWTLANRGRDARWKASILSDSSAVFYGETVNTNIRGNANRLLKDVYGVGGVGWSLAASNMYWKKGIYTNVTPRIYVGVQTDYHNVLMRLGRVYLNLAEAYLLKGDVANALTNLNKTRTVHGQLPPSTASALADVWEDYKRERRVDLVLEYDYYYSLLRWGRYGGPANSGNPSMGTISNFTEPVRVMDVSKDRKSFRTITGGLNGQQYNNRRFDASRRYLFPIAQRILDNNSKFGPQNSGW